MKGGDGKTLLRHFDDDDKTTAAAKGERGDGALQLRCYGRIDPVLYLRKHNRDIPYLAVIERGRGSTWKAAETTASRDRALPPFSLSLTSKAREQFPFSPIQTHPAQRARAHRPRVAPAGRPRESPALSRGGGRRGRATTRREEGAAGRRAARRGSRKSWRREVKWRGERELQGEERQNWMLARTFARREQRARKREREKRRRREKRDGKTAAVFCPFPSPLIQSIRGSMSLAEGSERYEVRNRSERRGTRRKKRARVIDLSPLSSTRTTIDLSKKASAIIFLV